VASTGVAEAIAMLYHHPDISSVCPAEGSYSVGAEMERRGTVLKYAGKFADKPGVIKNESKRQGTQGNGGCLWGGLPEL
jgi:hypothetical protein